MFATRPSPHHYPLKCHFQREGHPARSHFGHEAASFTGWSADAYWMRPPTGTRPYSVYINVAHAHLGTRPARTKASTLIATEMPHSTRVA